MIVTVTPNPSIDRTVRLDRLVVGGLNRAHNATSEAAGKGINVSYALATEGIDTIAVLPLPSQTAVQYLGLLADAVPVAAVPIAGAMRVNVSIIESDGTVTKVNEPGPPLSAADAEAILNAAASAARDGWIVGCGSLPPGAPRDFYARLARLATRDRRVAVDASGDALATAVTAGIGLVKPNRQELEELMRRPLATLGAVLDAARALVAQGCGAALVSLGSDGALFVDAASASHAEARIADAANTVGAGDALLAGFLAAGARAEALPVAVAWAVAAVRSPGTRMRPVTEADRAAVIVNEPLDLSRRLVA
ncbi:MAG TPA: 1-phosphofructokinase family hexose kinase [Methylomirabilota bacterium]|nr:1-phosphofructokinase family hexose kinase [Methylomirabilota bacterium]